MDIFFGFLFAGIAVFIFISLIISYYQLRFKNKFNRPKERVTHKITEQELKQDNSVIVTMSHRPQTKKHHKSEKPVMSEEDNLIDDNENTPTENNIFKKSNEIELDDFNDIISFFILSKEGRLFQGYELLQVLLTEQLEFGDMNIFHKYEIRDGKKTIIFSLASAMEPGNFDLNNIGALSCFGLCMFMHIEGKESDFGNLRLMYQIGSNIADELGGVLCDANRVPLSSDSLKEYFQIIQRANLATKSDLEVIF